MGDVADIAEDYVGYDSFKEAMLAHADARKAKGLPPQQWNPWQKEAAATRSGGEPACAAAAGLLTNWGTGVVFVVCGATPRAAAAAALAVALSPT